MANILISNIQMKGLVTATPKAVVDNSQNKYFPEEEIKKIIDMTGVQKRRVAATDVCTSDLCYAAAKELLAKISWQPDEIDILIFVSQTPDFILPATSGMLHKKLELSQKALTFDINQGCSGFVYGLYLASSLLEKGTLKKALVLVGDTCSKFVSEKDRSTSLLFGDAGSAVALEYGVNENISFHLGTDGAGFDKLIIPAGSYRSPSNNTTKIRNEDHGNFRNAEELYMDGAEIFNFTIKKIPSMLTELLEFSNKNQEQIDYFIFHQANLFMLNHLRKKTKIAPEKFLTSIQEYGNTSSASIPLTLTVNQKYCDNFKNKKLALLGFGVGFSWAGCLINTDHLKHMGHIDI